MHRLVGPAGEDVGQRQTVQSQQHRQRRQQQRGARGPGQRHFAIARHVARQHTEDFAVGARFRRRDGGFDAVLVGLVQHHQLPEAPPPPNEPPPPENPPPPPPQPPRPPPPPPENSSGSSHQPPKKWKKMKAITMK